jgi:hypothetical protein
MMRDAKAILRCLQILYEYENDTELASKKNCNMIMLCIIYNRNAVCPLLNDYPLMVLL